MSSLVFFLGSDIFCTVCIATSSLHCSSFTYLEIASEGEEQDPHPVSNIIFRFVCQFH